MSFKPKDTKERILHRLKIATGHVKKIQAMVDQDVYCIDIIHQSQAVQKALKEVDSLLLERHLKSCVVTAISQGKTDEAVSEVLHVFDKSNT